MLGISAIVWAAMPVLNLFYAIVWVAIPVMNHDRFSSHVMSCHSYYQSYMYSYSSHPCNKLTFVDIFSHPFPSLPTQSLESPYCNVVEETEC